MSDPKGNSELCETLTLWHVTCTPPIENVFKLGGITIKIDQVMKKHIQNVAHNNYLSNILNKEA